MTNDLILESLVIIFLLLLLLLSGLASGSETALFAFPNSEKEKLKNSKKPKDQQIIMLLEKPSRLLATILILNNIINISFVLLSTILVWKHFGKNSTTSFLLISICATSLLYLFGETFPKILASKKYYQFAVWTSYMILTTYKLLLPFSRALAWLSKQLESIMPNKRTISKEDVSSAFDLAEQKQKNSIVYRAVQFANKKAQDVMTSRTDMLALHQNTQFSTVLEKIKEKNHSRIPIFKDTIDHIEGILYVKDLLPFFNEPSFDWRSVVRRNSFFIPENRSLQDLLRDFQNKKIHMAIVVDEFGGVSGLVTLEDVIEEIVGQIHDEFDQEDILYKKVKDNVYWFNPKISAYEFCDALAIDINTFRDLNEEIQSLSGILLEIHQKMPRRNAVIEYKNLRFTVKQVTARKIQSVFVQVLPTKEQ